ncbi:MAG: carotenoid oxygenase family protein, partial [Leptolyngbyaceae cyanobacterium RM1_405_57]|nr:carotenoid oxygenase family protein [Leptolyngbyaceae cyanobacterium RM1_405_57]
FCLDLKTNTVERKLIESRCCEFPFVHPNRAGRPYRYVYLGAAHAAQGNAPLQAILKVDLVSGERQIWSAAPRGYVGEPIFVPRPTTTAEQLQSNGKASDEDSGWLLTMVYNSEQERSELVILDAKDLTKEPVARLHLKHHVPYGLHGSFASPYFDS